MKNKIFLGLIILIVALSFAQAVFASDFFGVEYDAALSEISITYINPYYQNHSVAISVVSLSGEEGAKEIIYANQFKTNKNGVLLADGIRVPDDEFLTVYASPLNGSKISDAYVYNSYYKKGIWDIAAHITDAETIYAYFDEICTVFPVENTYAQYMDSDFDFCQKLALTREHYDVGNESEEEIKKLRKIYEEVSLCSATESAGASTPFETVVFLTDKMFEMINDTNFVSSVKSMEVDEYEDFITRFKSKDKIINSADDFYSITKEIYADVKSDNILRKFETLTHISEVSQLLLDDETIEIFAIDELIGKYKKLESTKSVDKALFQKSFKTSEDFVINLESAINSAIKSESKKDTPSGGSSSKTSAAIGAIGNTSPTESVSDKLNVFTDLSDFAWAEEYICKLYQKGIISGKGNGIFDPSGNLTREEAVKMICEAFDIESAQGVGFDDVSDNLWYSNYVYGAKAAGVVNGISENLFGIGLSVSRQDAVVMLYNAMSAKESYVTAKANIIFADEENISGYAKKSVSYMASIGVISGYEDGTFLPQGTITRAEFSTILGKIIE